MRRAKYRNCPTSIGDDSYRSKREASRHQELLLLERAGEIAGLTREVPFVLAPGVKIDGETRKRPALRYVLDFLYTTKDGRMVHEDAKGMQTPAYRIKKHLMKTVHGIDVREV
jgi:hypothetical protein